MSRTGIHQAAILCGGLGSRLGELTRSTPKPLLPVGNRPFLAILIDELVCQGVRDILLLAAFENAQIREFAEKMQSCTPGVHVQVAIEPDRAGTGGALWHARSLLQEHFYLLNGDSWLDAPIQDLPVALGSAPDLIGALSLRSVPDRSRYGSIAVEGSLVTEFGGATGRSGPGLINAGVYLFRREIVDHLPQNGSLEGETLPMLARQRRLAGIEQNAYFIDIGVPTDFSRAQTEVPLQRQRPALLIDPAAPFLNEWVAGARQRRWRVFALASLHPACQSGDFDATIVDPADLWGADLLNDRWPVQPNSGIVVANITNPPTRRTAGYKILSVSMPPQF